MEDVLAVIGNVFGAHRIRCAKPGVSQSLSDQSVECAWFAKADEPAQSSLTVGRGCVEQDAGHRHRRISGIEPFPDGSGSVSTLQRELSYKQVTEGVQGEIPSTWPRQGGVMAPAKSPPLVSGEQRAEPLGRRQPCLPVGKGLLAKLDEDTLASNLRTGHPCWVGPPDGCDRGDGAGGIGLARWVDPRVPHKGDNLSQPLGEYNALRPHR